MYVSLWLRIYPSVFLCKKPHEKRSLISWEMASFVRVAKMADFDHNATGGGKNERIFEPDFGRLIK